MHDLNLLTAKSECFKPLPIVHVNRLTVANAGTVQTVQAPLTTEELVDASSSATSVGSSSSNGSDHLAASNPVAPADRTVAQRPGVSSTSRPLIPQVDIQQLLDTLLGEPEVTLKDNTLLGSALVTDGESITAHRAIFHQACHNFACLLCKERVCMHNM